MKRYFSVKKGLWVLKNMDPQTLESLPYYEFQEYEEWLEDEVERREKERKDRGDMSQDKFKVPDFKTPKMPKIKTPKY